MTTDPDSPVSAIYTIGEVEIALRPVDHPDAMEMLRAFHEEQVGRYGFAESVDLNPSQYVAPAGVFVVVYHQGAPVGCGGYRRFGQAADMVEIKKTYLDPGLRGRGIGRALLSWLERHAAASGARQAILETGARNTAALRLFITAGYRPIPRYVSDRDPAINRAFAKSLTPMTPDVSERTRPASGR